MITLRFIDSPSSNGTVFKYKTLAGARAKAHKLVGLDPKRDPDGYVSHRTTGNCLFFQGATYEDLFLTDTQMAFLATLDPKRWSEVSPEDHAIAGTLEFRNVIILNRNGSRWGARRT